ncbi:putative RNA-binding protein containing KH domain, possibly ribosomal protein [Aciduliprofundum sp. MAR08-339]|nr:putative RNA-binding protein containing KH domain, possibly ribosomal protein [Aciduliprofundum sp. MAR08-339]
MNMEIKATVQIGKDGITEGVINEIKAQLKKRKIIKIKFLQNADRDNFREKIKNLAERSNADILEIRGFTAVLKKR